LVEGGHRVIARSLARALCEQGHLAEVLTTPQNRFGRQLSAYLATWLTDVGMTGDGKAVDVVVSLRFPSYAVRHPHHVVWLNHRMREYYDLWDSFRANLGLRGRLVEGTRRWALHRLDRRFLGGSQKVFAQSETIRRRLERWGGTKAEVLHPPAPQRPYRCDGYDGVVLSVARLQPLKRNALLLRALAESPGLSARIAGEGPEGARLRGLAEALQISDRVEFLGRLSETELVDGLGGLLVGAVPVATHGVLEMLFNGVGIRHAVSDVSHAMEVEGSDKEALDEASNFGIVVSVVSLSSCSDHNASESTIHFLVCLVEND